MRFRPALLLLVVVALGGAIAPSRASAAGGADVPSGKPLYRNGADGRILLGGTWLFRFDSDQTGIQQGFASRASTAGWSPVSVPNAWNANDDSSASMGGTVAWYRKDFRLPSSSPALAWIVRFESVNYRAQVWLNGKLIGENAGAYLPFEVTLKGLHRRGVNRLAVRVDNRRGPTDFPPSRFVSDGIPTGAWWNYGGLLREVYLRRVDRVDFAQVAVRPRLPCPTCAATVEEQTVVANVTSRPLRVHVAGRFGRLPIDLGTHTIGAGATATYFARIPVAHPKLWGPGHPNLYAARLAATAAPGRGGRFTRAAGYTVLSGIRSITVTPGGGLLLNGGPVHFRGVAMHEDVPGKGAALSNADRLGFIRSAQDLGATVIRAHYPLHPELEELADRRGILLWSEVPIYSLEDNVLAQRSVRSLAVRTVAKNVLTNQNHPSVAIWSIANELSPFVNGDQAAYIRSAVATAKRLDPTRPVGLAVAERPDAPCQSGYGPLDVVGINDYFGWYTGPDGVVADRDGLSTYLDQVHACYPAKAVAVTEFGVEANRDGPSDEKGTYAFQQQFVRYQLGAYATKPWLAGAIYWTLREFKINPSWDGGNPDPTHPLHQKGLLFYDGQRKPAYFDAQQLFRSVQQYGPPVVAARKRRQR